MKSKPKVTLIGVALLGVVLALIILVSAIVYSPLYIYRCLANGESKVTDYQIFPARIIAKSSDPYQYAYEINESFGDLEMTTIANGHEEKNSLEKMLMTNDTSSLVVIHKDKVVYEKYLNGYTKDTVQTSFSAVKSLDSLLIGAAIEDGYIQSENQQIADFIPEFKGQEFEKITIKDLLMMRSPIRYEEGNAWFGDDAKTYYLPDLRRLALNNMRVDKDYSGKFHYNNYHPLILGMILERSTGQSVSNYFQEKIWEKVGAENDASWSLDSKETCFEKMESGFNFKSIDFAKIGSMLLHKGKWNDQTIISENWIRRSVIAPGPLAPEDIDSEFLEDKEVGYQYMWYSVRNNKGGHDFFAAGKYGQYLYISPEYETVIVRTGIDDGEVDWWPDVLKQIAQIVEK